MKSGLAVAAVAVGEVPVQRQSTTSVAEERPVVEVVGEEAVQW